MSINQLTKERAEAAKKLAEVDAEIAKVEKLTQLYPDLKRYEGRWKKVVYCSPSVNSLVDKYETRHNCGCCGDSPMEFWPYVETEHGRVYSSPTGIFIGERDPFFGGSVSRPGWREDLKKHGIPEALIEQVSVMFKDERQKALEAVEERYADGAATGDPEPPAMKLYLVTRADLSAAQQAVQVVHAMREFVREHPEEDLRWYKGSNTLAFLAVEDEDSLNSLLEAAIRRRIPVAGFWEPDRNDELTAIAIGPQGKGLCRRLRLALSEVGPCAPKTCTPTTDAKTSTALNITTAAPSG